MLDHLTENYYIINSETIWDVDITLQFPTIDVMQLGVSNTGQATRHTRPELHWWNIFHKPLLR